VSGALNTKIGASSDGHVSQEPPRDPELE